MISFSVYSCLTLSIRTSVASSITGSYSNPLFPSFLFLFSLPTSFCPFLVDPRFSYTTNLISVFTYSPVGAVRRRERHLREKRGLRYSRGGTLLLRKLRTLHFPGDLRARGSSRSFDLRERDSVGREECTHSSDRDSRRGRHG